MDTGATPRAIPGLGPTGNTGCGQWQIGTMSGYDNLDGYDDAHPGCLAEYCGTNDAFLDTIPVVSILDRDFSAYKYHNIEIDWNGEVGTVQVWDQCVNADCSEGTDCCTDNAKQFGGDFLLDVDRHALKNVFGITNYATVLQKVSYRICGPVADQKTIATRWFGSNREGQTDSSTFLPSLFWLTLFSARMGLGSYYRWDCRWSCLCCWCMLYLEKEPG